MFTTVTENYLKINKPEPFIACVKDLLNRPSLSYLTLDLIESFASMSNFIQTTLWALIATALCMISDEELRPVQILTALCWANASNCELILKSDFPALFTRVLSHVYSETFKTELISLMNIVTFHLCPDQAWRFKAIDHFLILDELRRQAEGPKRSGFMLYLILKWLDSPLIQTEGWDLARYERETMSIWFEKEHFFIMHPAIWDVSEKRRQLVTQRLAMTSTKEQLESTEAREF